MDFIVIITVIIFIIILTTNVDFENILLAIFIAMILSGFLNSPRIG